jgi:hypothetical protein
MFHWFLDDDKTRLICAETGAMFSRTSGKITYWEPNADPEGGMEFDSVSRWDALVSRLVRSSIGM